MSAIPKPIISTILSWHHNIQRHNFLKKLKTCLIKGIDPFWKPHFLDVLKITNDELGFELDHVDDNIAIYRAVLPDIPHKYIYSEDYETEVCECFVCEFGVYNSNGKCEIVSKFSRNEHGMGPNVVLPKRV